MSTVHVIQHRISICSATLSQVHRPINLLLRLDAAKGQIFQDLSVVSERRPMFWLK